QRMVRRAGAGRQPEREPDGPPEPDRPIPDAPGAAGRDARAVWRRRPLRDVRRAVGAVRPPGARGEVSPDMTKPPPPPEGDGGAPRPGKGVEPPGRSADDLLDRTRVRVRRHLAAGLQREERADERDQRADKL